MTLWLQVRYAGAASAPSTSMAALIIMLRTSAHKHAKTAQQHSTCVGCMVMELKILSCQEPSFFAAAKLVVRILSTMCNATSKRPRTDAQQRVCLSFCFSLRIAQTHRQSDLFINDNLPFTRGLTASFSWRPNQSGTLCSALMASMCAYLVDTMQMHDLNHCHMSYVT